MSRQYLPKGEGKAGWFHTCAVEEAVIGEAYVCQVDARKGRIGNEVQHHKPCA
jgi:hypothetical protein